MIQKYFNVMHGCRICCNSIKGSPDSTNCGRHIGPDADEKDVSNAIHTITQGTASRQTNEGV